MKPLIALAMVLLAGCDRLCQDSARGDTGPTSGFAVSMNVEDEAHRAGVADADLRAAAEEALLSNGVPLADPGQPTNYTISISVRLIDTGGPDAVGMITVSTREPATVWTNAERLTVITDAQQSVFSVPRSDLPGYAREFVASAIHEAVKARPQLAILSLDSTVTER